MPKPALRNRSKKRRRVRLPGGRVEIHYGKEKTSASLCARCGRTMSGLPRSIPSRSGKLSASERSVERMFGGQLCSSCLRDLLKQSARDV